MNRVGIHWQGTDKVWSQGDFNGDGIVGASDLNDLGVNWQKSIISGPQNAAVPEPSSIALLLFTGLGLRIFRRR